MQYRSRPLGALWSRSWTFELSSSAGFVRGNLPVGTQKSDIRCIVFDTESDSRRNGLCPRKIRAELEGGSGFGSGRSGSVAWECSGLAAQILEPGKTNQYCAYAAEKDCNRVEPDAGECCRVGSTTYGC